jgi:hypothetical protein
MDSKAVKKTVKPKMKLIIQATPSQFPTEEEISNCYVTETAKALDCKSLVAHVEATQKHKSVCRKYRYIAGKRQVLVKVDGIMRFATATTIGTGYRYVDKLYRDEMDYNSDRDAPHFKYYFNIFKMKKQLKGEKTKEGFEKKSNGGCKIARVTRYADGSVSIARPSTNSKEDLLKFMTNNGMTFGDVEYRMKSYEERVTWIIKGRWEYSDSPDYKAYQVRMYKAYEDYLKKESKEKDKKDKIFANAIALPKKAKKAPAKAKEAKAKEAPAEEAPAPAKEAPAKEKTEEELQMIQAYLKMSAEQKVKEAPTPVKEKTEEELRIIQAYLKMSGKA